MHQSLRREISSARAVSLSSNSWNASYPLGGNYWGDYVGIDGYGGPYQNETGSDGLGDTYYYIDEDNVDHYPLMTPFVIPEFPSFLVLSVFMTATLMAIIVLKRRHSVKAVSV